MVINRRAFLGAVLAAPFVVRSESLMRGRAIPTAVLDEGRTFADELANWAAPKPWPDRFDMVTDSVHFSSEGARLAAENLLKMATMVRAAGMVSAVVSPEARVLLAPEKKGRPMTSQEWNAWMRRQNFKGGYVETTPKKHR